MKNPLIPAGIEPATFRFVAQHLNHCATAVPNSSKWSLQTVESGWAVPELYKKPGAQRRIV